MLGVFFVQPNVVFWMFCAQNTPPSLVEQKTEVGPVTLAELAFLLGLLTLQDSKTCAMATLHKEDHGSKKRPLWLPSRQTKRTISTMGTLWLEDYNNLGHVKGIPASGFGMHQAFPGCRHPKRGRLRSWSLGATSGSTTSDHRAQRCRTSLRQALRSGFWACQSEAQHWLYPARPLKKNRRRRCFWCKTCGALIIAWFLVWQVWWNEIPFRGFKF